MPPKNEQKEFWKKILALVQLEVTPMVYGTIISRTMLTDFDETQLTVACEDEFIKKTIQKKYLQIIQEAANKIAGDEIKVVLVVKSYTAAEPKQVSQTSQKDSGLGPLFQPQKDAEELYREKVTKSGLSQKFTLDSYIMGKSNQLAYAIASAVADRPGEVYNPVFFYAGVGLGKTHLLQAIGNKILKNKPGAKVIYTTGENFTNELVDAIQSGKGKGRYTSNNFRDKYRKADVFLIDDVQFIAGKEATQEEFFHTFNALYMAQKQIIVTSDRPPKDFTNLEERITSRFNSGILVDIQPPDIEMRTAILREKRDIGKDNIPNIVIDFIAETISSNIRELEGAYLQILTHVQATGKEPTVEIAAQILGKTVKEKASKNINMNQVLNAVCTYYSLKGSEIKGKKRTKEVVVPRQVAMYLIKELTNTPYMTIGHFLGGRDHSTVMHGVEKIENEQENRSKIKQDLSNVKQIIYSQ
jgi:chromosomal replication initiator protein